MKHAVSVVTLALLAGACGSLESTFRAPTPLPAPIPAARPTLGPREVAFTWLGAAGVLVRTRDKTIAMDPYVSRENLPRVLIGNLRSDERAVDKWIPKVDLILVGHSHADHILDVPYLMKRDGAHVVGTLTTSSIVQSYGARKEQVHVVGGGELINVNGVMVNPVKAAHGKWLLGKVPTPGSMVDVEPAPLRGPEFKMGGALFWRIVVDGIRIGHLSSGAVSPQMRKDLDVDVLFMSMAAAKDKGEVLKTLIPATNPGVVVPIHFDMFFLRLEQSPRRLPGYDPFDVALQVSTLAPKSTTILPEPMREFIVNVDTHKYR